MDIAYLDKHREISEIYGVAWESFARAERGDLVPRDETLTSLRLMLEDILRSGGRLPYLLYDRRTGVGVLLSAYVLSKLKSKPRLSASDLKRVVDIVREWDCYSLDGEALFALYLLSRVRHDVVKREEILGTIEARYAEALAEPAWSEATAEDVSRAIFTVLAHVYERECEENTIKFLINNSLFSRAARDLDLLAVYCFTLAKCVRRMSTRLRRKMYVDLMRALRLASGELRNLSKLAGYEKLRTRKVIRRDLEAKVELAKHELGKAIKQLQKFGREDSEKRSIARTLTIFAALLFAITVLYEINVRFHLLPDSQLIQITILIMDSIVTALLILAAKVHPSTEEKVKFFMNIFKKIIAKLG